MKNEQGNLAAPFPWFGGKSGAVAKVWKAFGTVQNYVEPFAGSAAMLLGAPKGKRVETINDADGHVANFWRAISQDPEAVAYHADWPVNETDLFARHSWLVRHKQELLDKLHGDPDYFDAKTAGWWVWGACAWIGSGWCSGKGPWVHDGETLVYADATSRQLPSMSSNGINRKLPSMSDRGINLLDDDAGGGRTSLILDWFTELYERMRDVRVTCGDWSRVCKDSVTVGNGLTGVFLDPPYTKGAMDYAAGGCGGDLALDVQNWCIANGGNPLLRIVLCGHDGEHDALLAHGWEKRGWVARTGYAKTEEAKANSASETIWCSPHCVPEVVAQLDIFAMAD